jgi:mannose-6-phosphate isomerase-like protein (cupin superfamily)
MPLVISLEELSLGPIAALFEGGRRAGVDVSFYDTRWPRGGGPSLHSHPYAEVFLVLAGRATFVVDGEELAVDGGHVVVVPAETPHRFLNRGDEPLHVVSIHPRGRVEQRDLEVR